ncbi:MAG TPA: PQQ-binding-like beta-propeller repeat protein [Desulfuromonadales bacterium]|nr:PQQ-binding-like beta-propeller repeat protein [Desulfuromonadales bacterium]
MLKRIILSGSLVALSVALAPAPNASANWATYQYNAQHSGKAPVKGPSLPVIKWQYQAPSQTFTDPNDPNNLWTTDQSFTAGVAEGTDGTIYAAGDDGRAYAFDPRTGAIKYLLDGVGVCCAPPVVGKDGTIYFSGNGLWALNPDFSIKFYYPDGGNCCGAITVADDGTVIVGNGWLHAFDVNNLVFLDPTNSDPLSAKIVAPKWIYNERGADWSAAVTPDGATVYAENYSGELVAIDPNNLTLNPDDGKFYAATKWFKTIINDRESNPVIAANGNIYIADDQKVISINPTTLAVQTIALTPGYQVSNFANNGGTLYATAHPVTIDPVTGARSFDENAESSMLYAINPTGASVTWSAVLPGAGEYANPIIDNTGSVYVGTIQKADGVDFMANVNMFTPAGVKVFTYSKGTILGNDLRRPIIGMDGTLYVIIDGSLVAIGGTADLSVDVVASPSPVTTNAPLSVTATVTNAGPDKAVASIVKVTLPSGFSSSASFVAPANCIMNSSRVASCVLGEIVASTSASVTFTGIAPATVGNASFTATTKSDVPDPITTNNSKTITVPVTLPVSCDLVVSVVPKITTSTGTSTTSVTRGTTKYNFIATVKNQGTGTCAASTLGFYFSTNTTIDSSDYKIGTAAVTSLAAGASKAITLNVAVPTSLLSASSYYLGAFADSPAVITEKIETNNTSATASKITVK